MADRNAAVRTLDRPDASAMGEMVNAELANQIATAKKYPRDENAALSLLEKLATKSDAVAEQCMYTLKRTQKNKETGKKELVFITGPSIHFMQLLNYCWGNMRAGARIVEEGQKTVTAQGLAYDLQRNNGLLVEIKRGIATSEGHRYSQDMINMTSNAACSIAERNAIEDCIPRVLWWGVYEAVKDQAVGAAQVPEKCQQAVKFFVSKGAVEADILTALGVQSVADLGRDHLEIFYGLRTALKEGSIEAAKIFTAEGADQRAKLNLTEDDDTPDPNAEQFNSIDKLVQGGAQQNSAAPKDGAKGEGDGGSSREEARQPQGKGKQAKAGSQPAGAAAADPKTGDNHTPHTGGDGGHAPAAQENGTGGEGEDSADEDEELLKRIDAAMLAAQTAIGRRNAMKEHRGALAAIVERREDKPDLQERASKILKDFPPR